MLFQDPLHEQLAGWTLAFLPYGAADHGVVAHIAGTVGDGGDDAFYDAWTAAGARRMEEARAALAHGHPDSAREALLHAATYYGKAYHPLYGAPVDPRLLAGARRQYDAFQQALALDEFPGMRLEIPFEDGALPAWLIPARVHDKARRPLVIFTNGYDATVPDAYFGAAVAASKRGYHGIVFDGPGQGMALFEQGLHLRPDWETVVRAVFDVAQGLSSVDPERIALYGWSLGGYLAPRAAAHEPRLAACIADPGRIAVADGFRAAAIRFGLDPAQARDLGALPDAVLARMEQAFMHDRVRRWSVAGRGYWVHGVDNLRDYLASVERFTLADSIKRIRCPTLVTRAEDDPLADGAQAFYDGLDCPKTLLRFSAQDAAGGHCEMGNRSLLNRRVLDWLDELFI